MKKLIVFLLLLLPLFSAAGDKQQGILVLTKDSLTNENSSQFYLSDNWRFHPGDSAAWSDKGFNDGTWVLTRATMHQDTVNRRGSKPADSIAWYRLHFIADSSIVEIPVALEMSFMGAAEVYFDGSKIKRYGKIGGKDSVLYFSSNKVPFIFLIRSPGEHVLAVRFLNYVPATFIKTSTVSGFSIWIGEADNLIVHQLNTLLFTSPIFTFLLSIFLTLCVVHLLLFLYYRSALSNLFFSIFCLSLGFVFFLIYLSFVSEDPHTRVVFFAWAWPVTLGMSFFSFSGINNELFGGKRLRFRIITAICLFSVIVFFFNRDAGGAFFSIIGIVVMIEAIILTVRAIIKKRRGARIVGIGILFFAVFILATLSYVLLNHGMEFGSGSIYGAIYAVLACCAVISIPFSMSVYLSWNFAAINKDISKHLQQVQLLSEKSLAQEHEKKRILETQKEKLEEEVAIRTAEVVSQKERIEKQHGELKIEKKKSDDLLLNILPEEIAEELKETGHSVARYFNDVTVIFTDFVGFTRAGERMTPQELVDELHACFKAFDDIISKYNIEKIKTIGDAYLAVCGLPLPVADHAANVVKAALDIRQFMHDRKQQLSDKVFEIRIGIHSGSVVAGIVGVKKFAYDIWGDTVNTAARMEQNSEAGKINISQTTYDLVKNNFECRFRGEISAKNKGELSMYFVEKQAG